MFGNISLSKNTNSPSTLQPIHVVFGNLYPLLAKVFNNPLQPIHVVFGNSSGTKKVLYFEILQPIHVVFGNGT